MDGVCRWVISALFVTTLILVLSASASHGASSGSPGASSAAALGYPRTCPIANPNGYRPYRGCLIDSEARNVPTGSLAGTTLHLQRPEVGITVSPQVVRYGQTFTVRAVESFPQCHFNDIPDRPSGCVNSGQAGLVGFYLRLLPLVSPESLEYVASANPEYARMVRQSGRCTISTSCTFKIVAPGPGDARVAARLRSHWIVAGVNVYIIRGVEQGTNRIQWLQDPARTDRAEVETAIRLCAPSAPCPNQVSGRVSQQGASATGLGGLTVRAACPSGGTTTTDSAGRYSFLLNRGKCPISVTPPSGETATPKVRVVHVGSQNIKGVDFTVGCAHGKGARAAASTKCLDVQVKTIGPTRSGLGIFRHFAHEDPSRAFFQPPFSKHCASGCSNVVVTVTDPLTGQPVEGATVDASVTGVRGVTGGHGFLCDQAGPRDCGSHLINSMTDASGQVHLLYWSPGLITAQRPTIRVVARDGTHEGNGERTFTVKPYLIYEHTGTLTRTETLELAYWPAGKSLLAKLGKLINGLSGLENGLTFSLNVLIGAEHGAEHAVQILEGVEAVTPIIGVLEVAHLGSELWERQGFVAMFLDSLDLSAIGIDDNPVERAVSAAPAEGFMARLANLGTIAPFHAGAGGLLWEYAKHLDFLFEHHDVAFGAQFLHVKVYEVSHCQEGELCGPGYRTYIESGIKPELYIEVSAERNRRAQSLAPHSFTIPYDPNAWAESQHNLKDLSR